MNSMQSKTLILFTVILMDLLAGMEFDLFVPSFPELQHYFNLSPFWVEALLSVNFVGYCLSLFFVGKLGDYSGPKPIIVWGLITFTFGSILCLWPEIYSFILLGRFLQGIGIAAPAILSFVIIANSYPLKKQQFFMAILNGAMNISVAVAPVIGSYLTLYFHWQGNFMALLILGLVTLVMTGLFIPSVKQQQNKEAPIRGYLTLLQSKPLLLLITNLVLTFVPYWIFVGMSSLLYIKNFGVKLSHFGYYQGALALTFALGSLVYGLVIRGTDYNQKKMLKASIHIFIVSLISIIFITASRTSSALWITLGFLPFIIGQVIPTTLLYPLALNFLPQAKGKISSLIQAARLVVTAICLQVAGSFYDGSFTTIGWMISFFILSVIITLWMILKNRELVEVAAK